MKKTVKKKKLVLVKTPIRQLTRDQTKDAVGGLNRTKTTSDNCCTDSYTACG